MSSSALRDRDLVFIDTETTGLIHGYHEIVDLALVRTGPDAARVLDVWSVKICPLHLERMTAEALAVNGYNRDEWRSAAFDSAELWEKANAIMRGCIAVCHNPSFDRAMISIAMRQWGMEPACDYHWVGTESMAWPLVRAGILPSLALSEIAKFFGIQPEPIPHTALNGATLCWSVYQWLAIVYGFPTT